MDVCPFVPVAGISMEECVAIAERFGRRLGEELGVPVFLYEHAAKKDYRRKLPDVRKGEYEGLAQRLKDPKWQPDFGPAEFVPEWGATATGARNFLIAYNVNIIGTSNQAHRIALNLREAGRGPEEPGRLKFVKGMGWFVDEYNLAQVTVNLNDYTVTSIHQLFEAVKTEARKLKVAVAGSEIVGLVPLAPILMAAEYYIEKENLFIIEEDQKIRLAIERLGLNSISIFDPQERIIDYLVAEPPEAPLTGMSLRSFIEEVASRSSAPGGGSVSAQLAAVGVALGSMVAKLTYGVRKFEALDGKMREIIPPLHRISKELIPLIDADTHAFVDYIKALRLPKETAEEKQARHEAMQEGLKAAIRVPLATMRLGDSAWDSMRAVAKYGNPASKSDIQVGARALEAGIWGAWQNVLINMNDIEDESFKTKVLEEAEHISQRARDNCAETLSLLDQR
jgi:glutamate formiminotransferase/formiminotetrahydrofolate cyclodeaminase